MDVPPEDQNSQHGQEASNPTSHCAILPTFHGMESENLFSYIKEFEEVCNTFQEGGASIDLVRLKLFPFALKDKAKIWLNYLRPRSIRTWTDYKPSFLRSSSLLIRPMERYMEAINACPHHDFDTWLLVSYFYDGMSSSMKQLLETMCGGDFMSKNLEEAMDFLNYVVEVSRGWDKQMLESYGKEIGRTRNEEWLQEVQAISETPVQAMPCSICQSYEHLVDECPTIPACKRKESFLLNLIKNPKGIHEVEAQEGESSKVREVKVVITLRSGKEVDQPTSKPKHDEESVTEKGKSEEMKGKRKGKSIEKDDRDSNVNEEPERLVIREDMDLCIVKRGLNVNKKAFLTEQELVGESFVGLGSKLNLLPYFVYKQLGLGELKPTSITLSLADRLVKIPRGMIEDVCSTSSHLYKKHLHPEEEEDPEKGYLNPQICLLTYSHGGEEKKLYPYSMRRRKQRLVNEELPKLILKPLPHRVEEDCLLEVLRRSKKAIGWKISDLKEIIPLICIHHIYMEDEAKPVRQPHRRRLNVVTRKDHFRCPLLIRFLRGSPAILSIVFWMATPAYESIQACQMMEELLGQVMAKLLEAQIHEEPSFGAPYPFAKVVQSMQGKNNGKEEKQAK
ncbi:hypothetical protein CK203_106528 [Vitis vinifera]|uniref:Retrotransposon gag domain-containing protein n=1 Tax=Vitis vinifera TaxID=29760 RepID=A0A438D5Q8_VITVI|nr:hypothetical protein CK203_106528 [Vitis vinifera]